MNNNNKVGLFQFLPHSLHYKIIKREVQININSLVDVDP